MTVKEMIDNALIAMSIEQPILCDLAIKMGITIVKDPEGELEKTHVAWTDGTSLYFNESLIEKRNQIKTIKDKKGKGLVDVTVNTKNIQFLIAHEIGHIITFTKQRGEDSFGLVYKKDDISKLSAFEKAVLRYKHTIWNDAADYEINALLINNKRDGRSEPIGTFLRGGCYDPKYNNMTAEEIYKELIKPAEKNIQIAQEQYTQLQEALKQNPGKSLEEIAKELGIEISTDGTGIPIEIDMDMPSLTDGNGNEKSTEQILQEIYDKFGKLPVDIHKPIKDNETKNNVLSILQQVLDKASKDCSSTDNDSFINRLLTASYKPIPFDWKKALTKYVKHLITSGYTYNKPSILSIATGKKVPATYTLPFLRLGIAIDTSGSIGDEELQDMLNHVYTLMCQLKNFEIKLWACSTKVHTDTMLTITKQNRADLNKFKCASTGGTDMSANLKYIQENFKGNNKLDAFICITDGYDSLDGDTETVFNTVPIVFIIIDHPSFKKPTKVKCEVFPYQTKKGKEC